ncbi:nucleolar pre-ribosomal-associated protein 1-like [Acridotheres tristis]
MVKATLRSGTVQKEVTVMLDTGADVSIIYKESWPKDLLLQQTVHAVQGVIGLESFVSLALALPSPRVYDAVEGYVKISVECAEIYKLLDGERKPESEMLLIFQALEAILLRTVSNLSHFSVVGMNIVKKLINSYVKLIYAALYSENCK